MANSTTDVVSSSTLPSTITTDATNSSILPTDHATNDKEGYFLRFIIVPICALGIVCLMTVMVRGVSLVERTDIYLVSSYSASNCKQSLNILLSGKPHQNAINKLGRNFGANAALHLQGDSNQLKSWGYISAMVVSGIPDLLHPDPLISVHISEGSLCKSYCASWRKL